MLVIALCPVPEPAGVERVGNFIQRMFERLSRWLLFFKRRLVFYFLSDLSWCRGLFCVVFLFPCLITRCILCFWQVCLSVLDEPSVVGAAETTAIAELAASAATRWNILLYGIQLSQSKVNITSLKLASFFFPLYRCAPLCSMLVLLLCVKNEWSRAWVRLWIRRVL